MLTWNPTTSELMRAVLFVLNDRLPASDVGKTDAVMVHGSPWQDEERDMRLAESISTEGVGSIVLNALTAAECTAKNIPYCGCELFQDHFAARGVEPERMYLLPNSPHTGAEARNFLLLAKARGWRQLQISTQPHHQLRCFLTVIAVMDEVEYYPAVYNRSAPDDIDWDRPMKRNVMKNGTMFTGADEVGTFLDFLAGEFKRIVTYAQPPEMVDGKAKYTRNATVPEMFAYLEQRRSGKMPQALAA